MNYTSARLPEAYISVSKNKSRLKIYGNKNVFLKDGEEFQIELFNPTTKTIGAKISINGSPISNSLLILKPGERSYLERYLDTNRKFVFETYTVEDSKETKEAIKNNGGIKIEFFNEKAPTSGLLFNSGTGIVNTYNTFTYPYYNYTTPGTITIGTPSLYFGSGISGSSGCVGIAGTSSGIVNTFSTGTTLTSSNNIVGTSTNYCHTGPIDLSTQPIVTSTADLSASPKTVETGRIEKGDVSAQSFGNYYGDFESYYFATTEYNLLPESQKPIEVKDLRHYCPGCRVRIKKASWKFCPSCGETLD